MKKHSFKLALFLCALVALMSGNAWADRQPDERSGPQVHLVRAVPKGQSCTQAEADAMAALRGPRLQVYMQTHGDPQLSLALDTAGGRYDSTCLVLKEAAADITSTIPFLDSVTDQVHGAGLNNAQKIYAMVLDGVSPSGCSPGNYYNGSSIGKNVVVIYGSKCDLGPSGGFSAVEVQLLQSIFANIAYVPPCAKNFRTGGWSSNPQDLLAEQSQTQGWAWFQSRIIPGPDGYFQTGRRDCPDLALSPYIAWTSNFKVQGAGKLGLDLQYRTGGTQHLECSASCSWSLPGGTQVTVTATAASGSTFSGWSGDCTGQAACVVMLDRGRTVTANFSQHVERSYRLTIGRSPHGMIVASPSSQTGLYPEGTRVTLTARPQTGWHLSNWTGACTGKKACVLVMNSSKTVSAKFVPNTVKLTVLIKYGNGKVVGSNGRTCTKPVCVWTVAQNKTIRVTAQDTPSAKFCGWVQCFPDKDHSTDRVRTLRPRTAVTITAMYVKITEK